MRANRPLFAVLIACAVGFGTLGCTKKQVRDEGSLSPGQPKAVAESSSQTDLKSEAVGTVPLSPSNPVAIQPSTKAPVASPADKTVPPATSGALPEQAQPAPDRGLGGNTTSGLARIHFGLDQATLTEEARETLTLDAKYLRVTRPGARVRIEGHCDERGTAEYNLALGEKRALAALQYLADVGVDKSRLSAVSYGKESPLDPAHAEGAWAANRRDEVVELPVDVSAHPPVAAESEAMKGTQVRR